MIVRVSAKLGKKIHVSPAKSLSADPNPFADWSTHLFTADRAQYILITNTASLYSMVMYGRGITDDGEFLSRITTYMREFMCDDGLKFLFQRLVAPSATSFVFSKALPPAWHLASGRIDALVTVIGMFVGAHFYVLICPSLVMRLERILNYDGVTLPQITGTPVDSWIIPILVAGSLTLLLTRQGNQERL